MQYDNKSSKESGSGAGGTRYSTFTTFCAPAAAAGRRHAEIPTRGRLGISNSPLTAKIWINKFIQTLFVYAIIGFIVFYPISTRMRLRISIFLGENLADKVYLTKFGVRKTHLGEHRINPRKIWRF